MKSKHALVLAAGIFAAQSHAIVGLGFHWAPGTGSLDGSTGEVIPSENGITTSFDQGKVSGTQGFGGKLWIDVLPFIDIEGTFNMQFARYDADLVVHDSTTGTTLRYPLKVKLDGFPLKEASPAFGTMSGDLSILYPFLKFPPAISLVRLYAGVGISYFVTTPVVDAEFTKKVLAGSSTIPDFTDEAASQQFVQDVADKLVDEGFSKGIGGHVMAGARFKVPIIPIAAYANAKYYFGGPESAYTPGAVFELGGGFAF